MAKTDELELREQLHNILDKFFEPDAHEKYVLDLEDEIMGTFDQVSTRRAAEAVLDELEYLDGQTINNPVISMELERLQPTKRSK